MHVLAPDDDRWKLPPLTNAATGVVRLRNGEERAVHRRVCDGIVEDAIAGSWTLGGERNCGGRHPYDIVAQVSVGPTGPGVYETDMPFWEQVALTAETTQGWQVEVGRLYHWDTFGRCFSREGTRNPLGDLRRRVGDLPDEEPVPAEVQQCVAAVERVMESAKTVEPYRDACERLLGVAKRVVCSDGREGVVFANDDLPPLLVALAAAVGKRDEPEHDGARPGAEPAASVESIPVGTGHADYRCRNGKVRHLHGRSDMGFHLSYAVPDGDDDGKPHEYLPDGRERAGDREWDVVGVVPPEPNYPASEGAAAMAEMLSDADLVPVSRDDLRVLWNLSHDFICENPPLLSEAEYGALSRAAAALGETLPEWMQEHARKEGWM